MTGVQTCALPIYAFVAGFKLLMIDYENHNVRGVPVVLDTAFFGATVGFTFD